MLRIKQRSSTESSSGSLPNRNSERSLFEKPDGRSSVSDTFEKCRGESTDVGTFGGVERGGKSDLSKRSFWSLKKMTNSEVRRGTSGARGSPAGESGTQREIVILKEHNVFGKPGKSRRGGHLRDCGWGKKCSA
jgi:hypothetical protein